MPDHIGSDRGTWWVVGIVLVGVLLASALPRPIGLASNGGDHLQLVAVMGSTHRQSETSRFESADMTAVMGSCSLDLRRTQIAPGGEASLQILAMMGSVTIRVPDGWTIDTRAIPVMGGIRDQRRSALRAESDANADGERPRLVLHGFVMMGSVIIRS